MRLARRYRSWLHVLDRWYLHNLVCPIDRLPLSEDASSLACAGGHDYPVVDGVPVMLVRGATQTIDLAHASLGRAHETMRDERAPDLHLESLGISEEEKQGVLEL